jgi:hypothetical protein
MNKLSIEERAKVIGCLIEGCSLRSTVRMTGVAKKTVSRILVEVGEACAAYHDKIMRNLPCQPLEGQVECRRRVDGRALETGL